MAFAVLALLSLQFLVLGLVQAWRDSPTYDEKYHLSGGVTAITEHQLRLTPEHPPLPKVLAALPVLATHPEIPDGRSWARGDSFTYPDEFLQAQLDAGKLQRVTFASRLVPLAIAIGAAWALYALAAGLFGRAAGLLAGGLWLTTPFVLGLGHLDGNDVGFTLVVVLAALALLRYVRAPTWGNAVIVGLAGGARCSCASPGWPSFPSSPSSSCCARGPGSRPGCSAAASCWSSRGRRCTDCTACEHTRVTCCAGARSVRS